MSKSILVIDTPKSCLECKLVKSLGVHMSERYGCRVLDTVLEDGNLLVRELEFKDYHKQRYPQCPLQDTTELLEALEVIGNEPMARAINRIIRINTLDEYNKLNKALGGEQ